MADKKKAPNKKKTTRNSDKNKDSKQWSKNRILKFKNLKKNNPK